LDFPKGENDITTRKIFTTVLFTLIVAVLPLLAGCQIVGLPNEAIAAPAESDIDYLAVENATVERWQTMARFYEKQSLMVPNLTGLSAEETLSYRWEAIARFYSQHPYAGVALTGLSDDEISAYRWLAAARYYAQNPKVDLTSLSPDEVLAYRWQAIARAYATK
jgi:hypothetical protein